MRTSDNGFQSGINDFPDSYTDRRISANQSLLYSASSVAMSDLSYPLPYCGLAPVVVCTQSRALFVRFSWFFLLQFLSFCRC